MSRAVDPGAFLDLSLVGRGLLAAMQAHPATEYLVVDDRRQVVGVLLTADVERALTTA